MRKSWRSPVLVVATLLGAVLPFSAGVAVADVTLASAPLHASAAVPPAPEPPTVAATDAPDTQPAAADAPAEVSAPAPAPAPSPCAEALDWVAGAGLTLPAGVGYHCPSTEFAHNGAACWYSEACPGQAFIAVNMDRMPGASVEYLHHVVAHEICHILDWQATSWTTEESADACAAAHGAPG